MAGGWVWAFLLAAVPQAAVEERDRAVTMELGPSSQGGSLEYLADFSGTLFVWADGEGFAPVLRVEDARGSVLTDRGAENGRCTPCVHLAVEPGERVIVRVSTPQPAAHARARVELRSAPETPETRDLAELARGSLGEAERARAAGDLGRARDEIQALVEELRAVPGRARSLAIEAVLWDAARAALELSAPAITAEALSAVLEHREIVLPSDHPDLLGVRHNLATVLSQLGCYPEARGLFDQALAAARQCLPEDHVMVLGARTNRANVLWALRELEAARAEHEEVLRTLSGVLPQDHLQLLLARQGLAMMLKELGELEAARGIEEDLLARLESARPSAPLELELARMNLSSTLRFCGDLIRARELGEQALEGLEGLVSEDHSYLQTARLNLGMILTSLGEGELALELLEHALSVLEPVRSPGDPDVLRLRTNLAWTLADVGQAEAAARLEEQVLSYQQQHLPPDHPDLQYARQNLAITCKRRGDHARALELETLVLEARRRCLPSTHPDLLAALHNHAVTNLHLGRTDAALALERELAANLTHSIRLWVATCSPRELESRVAAAAVLRDHLLSFALALAGEGETGLLEEAFLVSETSRNVALSWAELDLGTRGDGRVEAARTGARAASTELAHLVRSGVGRDELRAARDALDARTQELFACLIALRGGEGWLAAPSVAALLAAVPLDQVLVGFVEYRRSVLEPGRSRGRMSQPSYLAWVLGRERGLKVVDLGPAEPIEAAASEWRLAVLAPIERGSAIELPSTRERTAGTELRKLILDPLGAQLQGVRRLVVAPDGVLNALPLETLPTEEGALLGETLSVELRLTLRELVEARPAADPSGFLLALGGPSYNVPGAAPEDHATATEPPAPARLDPEGAVASVLRGSGWERGFPPLPFGRSEALSIHAIYAERFRDGPAAEVLEGRGATREALEELAPRSRFLHLATHGWYASESVRSTQDADGEPDLQDSRSLSREEQVRGSAPMLLCGLALAGANLPPDEMGRIAGLVTAEEIATWDLGACELAVLSACDTNVGVRRAGQGVASLQRALHMAGARSVITSLWKVPDEATQELMVDFYRRLWIDEQPKAQALWQARMRLRDARSPEGDPLHATRDWAGWVLSGDPD